MMLLLIAIARAAIAQLGERQTEDLKVPGSIPGLGISSCYCSVAIQGHLRSPTRRQGSSPAQSSTYMLGGGGLVLKELLVAQGMQSSLSSVVRAMVL